MLQSSLLLHSKGGHAQLVTFCDSKSYYCPSINLCSDRQLRCTTEETCNYTGYPSNHCFRNLVYPGAYDIQLIHTKLTGSLRPLRLFKLEHRFIQYRGFAYEFGDTYHLQVHDVNDPLYKYGPNVLSWRYSRKGAKNVGFSYCDYTDIDYLVELWKNFHYSRIKNNCWHFSTALELFLTSGPCKIPTKHRRLYNDLMKSHASEIIDGIANTCYLSLRWRASRIQRNRYASSMKQAMNIKITTASLPLFVPLLTV